MKANGIVIERQLEIQKALNLALIEEKQKLERDIKILRSDNTKLRNELGRGYALDA